MEEIWGRCVLKSQGLGLNPEIRGLLGPCRVGGGQSYLWGRHPRSTLLMPHIEGCPREVDGRCNSLARRSGGEKEWQRAPGGGLLVCSRGRDVRYSCVRPPGLLTLSLLDLKSRGTGSLSARYLSVAGLEGSAGEGQSPSQQKAAFRRRGCLVEGMKGRGRQPA